MTSLRTHVLTALSVLLALAVGVALGAGPLQRDAVATVVDHSGADATARRQLESRVAALRRSDAIADRFALAAAPRLLGRSLQGRVVTVLALPTADPADVSGAERLIRVAGGTVGGSLRLGAGLVDVADKQLVDQLGSQLQTQTRGLRAPADAGPYDRVGTLLARAVASRRPGGDLVDGTATSILAGLASAHLVAGQDTLHRRGDLVLLVTGDPAGTSAEQTAAAAIVASLVAVVERGAAGCVLAGTPAAAVATTGPLSAVRTARATARAVSTVDTLGTAAGRVTTVMALAATAAGRRGHDGSTAALP